MFLIINEYLSKCHKNYTLNIFLSIINLPRNMNNFNNTVKAYIPALCLSFTDLVENKTCNCQAQRLNSQKYKITS